MTKPRHEPHMLEVDEWHRIDPDASRALLLSLARKSRKYNMLPKELVVERLRLDDIFPESRTDGDPSDSAPEPA